MERVTIFIDGSNFYHGLKGNGCPTNVDFLKLGKRLVRRDRKLVRTYYYNAACDQSDDPSKYMEQQKFFSLLRHTPYLTLKLGRLEKRITTVDREWLKEGLGDEVAKQVMEFLGEKIVYRVEKGVDIRIASDMLRLAYSNAYDTAILVSGDGDYVAAVEGVQDLGKHVENAYFRKGLSSYLSETCDKFTLVNRGTITRCLSSR